MVVVGNNDKWELRVDDVDLGTAERMPYLQAIDAFAANWPEHMAELDVLRAEYVELMGEPAAAEKRQRTPGVKRQRGSGARFRELILVGKSNEECLRIVRAEFPDSKATLSDAAWNRYQLRKNPSGYAPDGSKV